MRDKKLPSIRVSQDELDQTTRVRLYLHREINKQQPGTRLPSAADAVRYAIKYVVENAPDFDYDD